MSLHSAKRRHGQAKRFPVFCFKYEFPVLYFRLCRLFVRFLDGKRICSLLRSFIHLSLDFFAVLHVSLCYRGKINLIYGICLVLAIYTINKLQHRKCFVRIFIHSLQKFEKLTRSLRSLVCFPKFCNS